MFEIIPNEQTPKADEIKNIDHFIAENKELLNDFKSFAEKQKWAAGLAANQLTYNGKRLNINVFAVRDFKSKTWSLVLNPIIHQYIGRSQTKIETCLSWGDKSIIADRFPIVNVSYYDLSGVLHAFEKIVDFKCQVFQHETDHLNGKPERIEEAGYKLPKIELGRNDLCKCGSGKKYKKCCLVK